MAEDDALHNPHDKLFKAGFSDPATAAAFFIEHLPPALVARLDWPGLQLIPGSFVSRQMSGRHSDLLFSAPLTDDRQVFIHLLFEHFSSPDPWTALRLLEYQVLIWQEFRKTHPDARALPAIIPVVLAQNDRVWEVKTQFAGLLDLPEGLEAELLPFAPDFRYVLRQLAEIPFEGIRGTPGGILVLRTMKAERLRQLLDDVVWDEALLVGAPHELLEQVLRYILGAGDVDRAAFETKLNQIKEPKTRAEAMTLAQQYHQEGRLENQQEAVFDALEVRFERVPEGLVEAVKGIREEHRLRQLLRTAIRCATLEEFAAAL